MVGVVEENPTSPLASREGELREKDVGTDEDGRQIKLNPESDGVALSLKVSIPPIGRDGLKMSLKSWCGKILTCQGKLSSGQMEKFPSRSLAMSRRVVSRRTNWQVISQNVLKPIKKIPLCRSMLCP